MPTKLLQHPHWLALERLRSEVEVLCLRHGDEACRTAPKEGGWSALQILNHILLSEAGTLRYMKNKTAYTPVLKKTTPVSYLRFALLTSALRSPFRFQAPEGVRPSEMESLPSLPVLLEQWSEVRRDFRDFLEQFPQGQENKLVFRHPIAGRLTLIQTLSFMKDHLNRHLKQIHKRLNDKGQSV